MKALRFSLVLFLLCLSQCRTLQAPSILLWLFTLFGQTPTYGEIKLEAETSLFTSEAGREAQITIELTKRPTSEVRIGPITVSDPTEGFLKSSGSLIFTPDNWNTPQIVTIGGVDDTFSDGNIQYQVFFGEFTTEDESYSNRATQSVLIVNTDNETSGVAASPLTGITTTEIGGTATISYVLQTKPFRNVTVKDFKTSLTTEVTVEDIALTFTPENWDTPQKVTVTGVRDFIIDGTKSYTVSTGLTSSEDPAYNSRSVPVVNGNNGDSDTAGFTVTAVGGTTTTEAGGQVQFRIILNSRPTSNVIVASLTPFNSDEISVTPATLTFTPSDWDTPQFVTVTGVNDFFADGDQSVTVVSSLASSSDANYSNIGGPVFSTITNQDNDTRGFAITPTTNATFSETGGSQVFQFRLTSQPPAGKSVRITGIATSNPTLVSVTPNTLTFDSTNWNVDQPVTATGIDNLIDEDTRTITFTFGSIDLALANRDPGYDSVSLPSNFSFFVTDNDTAGITRNVETGFLVDENAGPQTTSFTVRLNTQPTANVTIPNILSSNTSEIQVSPSSLTFTPANWNTPQTVTLTSVVDGTLDGNRQVTISYGNAVSSDGKYSGMTTSSSIATNVDSGSTRVLLTNSSSSTFQIGEGAEFTFDVRLGILPGTTVTIGPITSSDTTEFVILDASGNPTSSRTLTFTATSGGSVNFTGSTSTSSFNVSQTIRVRAVNDDFDDGNINATLQIPAASGSFYGGVRPTIDDSAGFTTYNPTTGNITLTNVDDDTKGFIYSASALTISEPTTSQTFSVRLNSAPCLPSTPGDLSTCGAGSITLNLNVSIPTLPTHLTRFTMVPSSLTFDSTNWNTPRDVTLTAIDDAIDQSSTAPVYTITTGTIGGNTDYAPLTPTETVSLTVNDNETFIGTARINFALAVTGFNFTAENGSINTLNLSLPTQPIDGNTVQVTITSQTPAEGNILDASNNPVASRIFTFDSNNWSTMQTVSIRGAPDNSDSVNVSYNITSSISSNGDSPNLPAGYNSFNSVTGPTVSLTNLNVSTNKINVVFTTSPAPVANTTSTYAESYGTITGYVVLSQAPTHNVVIPVSKSTTFPCRLLASPVDQFNLNVGSNNNVQPSGNITITPSNWNTIGTFNRIQIAIQNDAVDDGDVSCPVTIGAATSTDPFYSGEDIEDYTIEVTDNDSVGITFSNILPTSFITSVSGARSSLSVRPSTQPLSNVIINFAISQSYATVSPSSMTFTPSNYLTAQNLSIIGTNSGTSGDQPYDLTYSVTSSETPTGATGSNVYNALSIPSRSINHIENLFDIIPCASPTPSAPTACGTALAGGGRQTTPALTTTESGGQARFQIRLRARPTANVTIPIVSSNTNEGTVSPASLTFTNSTWNTYQDVVVTGVNDTATPTVDGDIAYQINIGPMTSTDGGFNGQTLPSVPVTNTDNETPGFFLSSISGNTTEAGGTATFVIRLNVRPASDVTIGLSSSNTNEGTVSPSSVTFTSANWNTNQTVTITGVNDAVSDGTVAYSIITAPASSLGNPYDGLNPDDRSVNNEGLAVTVSAISGNTTEAGGTATFTIVLGVQPDFDVTIPISSSNTNEGTVSPTSITFTTTNWNVPQIITVTGVDDMVIDGNQNYSIITDPIVSTGAYSGINPADVSVTNNE